MSDRILILNGTIVTAEGQFEGDLLIQGEQVAGLGRGFSPGPSDTVIDAAGCLVMPGIIDAHTHIALDTGIYQTPDDFTIGTRAAACGGVTTVIDFATQFHGQTFRQALENRLTEAKGRACVDFALHCMVTDLPRGREGDLAQLPELGVTSAKVYTTYRPNYYFDDDALLRALEASTEAGVLVMVHAENDALVTAATEDLVARGHTAWRYHPQSRPALAEVEAIHRALFLADAARAPIYIVHCSSGRSVELIREARRQGQQVYAETCPQYLLMDETRYAGEHPEWHIMQPPLRAPEERQRLETLVVAGEVDVLATDHCDYTLAQKTAQDDLTRTPGGVPGVETLLPLAYTWTVKRDLALEQLVALLSTNPARIFGLYPRKGSLQPGADADVVVYDPRPRGQIRARDLHSLAGYTPYEGMTVQGRVVATLSRGRVVYHDGEFVGEPGHGRYISAVAVHERLPGR
jgi:dihydropyrimidinase